MKNLNQKMISGMAGISFLMLTHLSYSQNWQWSNPTNGSIGSTTPNPNGVTGIGIGDFSTVNIGSALHVNTNLTTPQTAGGFTADEVFRTQVPSSTASNWRMFRGNDEMAKFWFATTANALNMHASRGVLRLSSILTIAYTLFHQ